MEEGWIYILVNSSMPGLVKVGRTGRTPRDRAAELSGVTGVAAPFIVAFEQAFADCHAAERAIHAALDSQGLRVRPNREFFYAAPSDIIRLVLQASDAAGPHAAAPSPATPSAEALMRAGDRALHGLDDALQDTGEAVRCFRLAAARGVPEACERLGGIYTRLYAARRDRAGRRRAMAQLKEGVRRGDGYCYAAMTDIFVLDGHAANTAKAWSLFFAAVPPAEAQPGNARFTGVCARYLRQCLAAQVAPAHLGVLRPLGPDILGLLLADMEAAGPDPAARQAAAGCLRWAYANLLPEPAPALRQAVARPAQRRWGLAAGTAVA